MSTVELLSSCQSVLLLVSRTRPERASPTRPTLHACDLRKRLSGRADSGLSVNGLNPLLVSSTPLPVELVRTILTRTVALVVGAGVVPTGSGLTASGVSRAPRMI